MNVRQVRLGLNIFTGLVVASVSVALAGLTWRLAGYSGAAPVVATVAGPVGDAVDINGLLALAPFGTPQAASDTASDGSLHLKGILLAVPASASAALIAGGDGKVTSYGIGAALGGGVVEAIEASQVIVRTPHGLQTIGFPVVSGPAAPTLGATDASAGFARVGAGPAPAAVGAPNLSGFRVDSSVPPALLAAGLQIGDIVVEVNGAPVTTAMGGDTIARNLAGAALHGGPVPVVVLRNGNRVPLRLATH